MIIQFIKDYLSNNSIADHTGFSLRDDGKGVFIDKWDYQIDEPSLPSDEDIIRDKVKGEIKIEAAKRIDNAYPEWRQRNYMAAVAEIHNKEIVAMKKIPFLGQYTLTADELQTMRDADACKSAITAVRVKSNQLETSLDSMTLDQLKVFDPTDDSNWI